jgi:F0F1-type ATP synthase assembly protein I
VKLNENSLQSKSFSKRNFFWICSEKRRHKMSDKETPKYAKLVEGADGLSLGISIVVAVLIGVGAGILMKKSFGYDWLLWLGVLWGIGGAILNVYKAYKKQVASYDEFKDDVRYKKYANQDDDEE